MPISSSTTPMDINTSEQLQESLERAKNAIQKLRDSGDIEAADILNEDFEELLERQKKMMELKERRELLSADSKQGIEDPTKGSALQCSVNRLLTPTAVLEYFGLSLPTDDAEDDNMEPLVLDENDPIHKKIISADEIIGVAVAFVDIVLEVLEETDVLYLAVIYERLEKQRKKFQRLQKSQASAVKLDITAELYSRDAYNYLETVSDTINDAAQRNPHLIVAVDLEDIQFLT
ncbi:hypothetical protein H0H93_016407 [Arthromyces matolae]|nr:hypothetical protein H0H93_016407 [Arthromyces matolae]